MINRPKSETKPPKKTRYSKHVVTFEPTFHELLIDNNMIYQDRGDGMATIIHPYTQFSITLIINRDTKDSYRIYRLHILREKIVNYLLNKIDHNS